MEDWKVLFPEGTLRSRGSAGCHSREISKNISGNPQRNPPGNVRLRAVVIPENASKTSSGYVKFLLL